MLKKIALALIAISGLSVMSSAHAEDVIGSVKVSWALVADHRIDIERVSDPRLPVICYMSHPITGGIMGSLGLAKNHSLFSLSCVQKKGVAIPDLSSIPNGEAVITERTSWFSKQLIMNRFVDAENHNVVYMVTAQNEIIDGSPFSSVSTVNLQ